MRSAIIFCLSYLSLPKTLSIVNRESDCLIITHNPKIAEFFLEILPDVEVQLIKSPSPLISKNFVLVLFQVLRLKKEYWNTLKEYTNIKVYFGFVSYCFMEAWLLKKLKGNGNRLIQFGDVKVDTSDTHSTLLIRLNMCMLRMLYDITVVPRNLIGSRDFCLSLDYFNSIQPYETDNPEVNSNDLSLLFKKISLPNNSIMLLTGGVVEIGLMSLETYKRLIKDIANISKGKNIFVKSHPRFAVSDQPQHHFERVEAFIPANLLMQQCSAVIGFNSATLFEASNQNILSISLLNLIDENPELTAYHKSYLESNCLAGKRIMFPSTIDELNELLSHV